jgi:hypothetical protein
LTRNQVNSQRHHQADARRQDDRAADLAAGARDHVGNNRSSPAPFE